MRGALLAVLALLPGAAGAQVLPSSAIGQCVGVSPGGTTDCRAVDVTIGVVGTLNLDALSFTIPSAIYGPGMWLFEDQFGGAMGQINPVDYSPAVLPDDYLFGYFDANGTLDLGPLFTPIALTPGTPLTVRMFFTEWMTEPTLDQITYSGGGLDAAGAPVTFGGDVAVAPSQVVPEPATVALLAGGLAGLGLLGAARRRRGKALPALPALPGLVAPLLALLVAACGERPAPLAPAGEAVASRTSADGDHIDEEGTHHSHWRFGHLTWEPAAGQQRTILFTFKSGFRRSGYSGTAVDGRPQPGDIINEGIGATGIAFGDGTSTGTLRFRVTSINIPEDYLFAEALHPGTDNPGVVHTYATNGTFTASSYSCCRVSTLRNGADGGYGVATVVHVGTGNRSPVSNFVPIVSVTAGGPRNWTIPAADADGDQLRFRLATPAEAGNNSGCCISQPAGLTVHPTTGVVSWNTTGVTPGPYWTQQIIEELNADGTVKGRVGIDYVINVRPASNNQPPSFSAPACNTSRSVVVGQQVNIPVQANDPDQLNTVTITATGVPPTNATFTSVPGNPATASFVWTPLTSQTGTRVITFLATDTEGAQAVCSITITASFQMDVWPGSISLSRTPSVWVTVLSTPDFNALTIDLASVTLGNGTNPDTPMQRRPDGSFYFSQRDFNGDGRVDRVFFFSVPELRANGDLVLGQTELVLRGTNTVTGSFRGTSRTMPTITP